MQASSLYFYMFDVQTVFYSDVVGILMNKKIADKSQDTLQLIESDSTSLIAQNQKISDYQSSTFKTDQRYQIGQDSSTKIKQSSALNQIAIGPKKYQQLTQSQRVTLRQIPTPQNFHNQVYISSEDSLALYSYEDQDILLHSESSEQESSSLSSNSQSSSQQASRFEKICSKYMQCFFKEAKKGQPIGITWKRHQINDQCWLKPIEKQMLLEKAGVKKANKRLFEKVRIWDVEGVLLSRNEPRRDISRFGKMLEREKNPPFPEVRQIYPENYLKQPNSNLPDEASSYYKLSQFPSLEKSKPKLHFNRIITVKQFDTSQSPQMIRQSPQTYQLIQLPKANPSHYFAVVHRDYVRLQEKEDIPKDVQQQSKQKQAQDLDSSDFVIISDEDSQTLEALDDS